MSIQAALSSALSSLAAEQRQSAVLANNIANANTAGYVRRELPRSERLVAGVGSGVSTGATMRAADAALAATSRAADASEAYALRMQTTLEAYNSAIGQPSDERSLSSRLGAFREAMTTLSSAADNTVAQSQALSAAQDLVDTLHAMDGAVSDARTQADLDIARDVEAVNTALDRLAEVDRNMAQASARGASTAEYEDQRDTLLAEISAKLPVRVYDNGPGRLVLMTEGGTTIYDSTTVHHLDFTHTPSIPAESRYPAQLSGVTVEGQKLRLSESGSIAASLKLRDETLPQFSDMLDQVAGRLVDAFQEADPTLGSTTPQPFGLFTRPTEASWDPTSSAVLGLARDIAINPAADPEQGGALWRLRTGMGAGSEGLASDNSFILGALDAMDADRSYAAASGLPGTMTLSEAASQSVGLMQGTRAIWTDRAETRASLALEARQDLTNETAVNIDEELQRLLLVQQTYSASVQVIQAASSMLDELTQIR
ncbi:flagellar hook-associated protein FlgK [Roseomonas sp. E05]|uniref:flagellar hook-associated protein FlgK n=1 Tax=Roseomonas sp. E05 TaxID=3046310 RepID=UPI0024B9026C|nr:flagellar hook-associated protein FlgK [Roseomonas sp. E05]MDJ0390360.1 flagellar hook-associated protein FlgK [Roseomonas sp. E05]